MAIASTPFLAERNIAEPDSYCSATPALLENIDHLQSLFQPHPCRRTAALTKLGSAQANVIQVDALKRDLLWVFAPLNNQFVQRAKILAACNDSRSIQTESDPLPLMLRQLPERKLCPIFSIYLRIHGEFSSL
jgi:hypothetical protein